MNIFDLTPISLLIGALTVILTAIIRFHYPFRYQYCSLLFKKHPGVVKKILQRSFKKNKFSAVGLLDLATKDILDGAFDDAEKHIFEGIQKVINHRGIRNQLIRTFFYNHLSWIFYYKEHHKESLEIALQLYEKVPSTPNILALILCNFARIGEIGRAIEVMGTLIKLKKVKPTVLLSCEAEIEAAKGNLQKAIQLFDQAKGKKSYASIYFITQEIDKRIGQLQKIA